MASPRTTLKTSTLVPTGILTRAAELVDGCSRITAVELPTGLAMPPRPIVSPGIWVGGGGGVDVAVGTGGAVGVAVGARVAVAEAVGVGVGEGVAVGIGVAVVVAVGSGVAVAVGVVVGVGVTVRVAVAVGVPAAGCVVEAIGVDERAGSVGGVVPWDAVSRAGIILAGMSYAVNAALTPNHATPMPTRATASCALVIW